MLMLSGSHGQARYSCCVHGTPPTTVQQLRGAVGSVTSAQAEGRCLTTALALDVGSRDPAYSAVCDVLQPWTGILEHSVEERARALAAWAPTVARLDKRRKLRWSADEVLKDIRNVRSRTP